jgi:NADPH-dependent curcumin reductase CurA
MTTTTSREVRLAARPTGLPDASCFSLATVEVPAPRDGEVQVRNRFMSVDPYMRGRMNDTKSYIPPFALGEVLQGGAVGEVVASNDPAFAVGDVVESFFGWREIFNAPGKALRRLELRGLPAQAFLGAAGMPGLTAWVGLMRIAAMKAGDVVFVSGAAGAVGSMVCQIAKLKGHTVIASAGGADKAAFLRNELHVDAVIDYKAEPNLTAALKRAAPQGIDVYFDNVGGSHLEAAISCANPFARFALCGMIGNYNATAPVPGPANLAFIVGKSLRLEGFIVGNHNDLRGDFEAALAAWHAEGKLVVKDTIVDGIDNAPSAFLGLFSGDNTGKMLVRVG